MADRIYIERLTRAIERAYNCRAKWVATGPIQEVMEGEIVWEGDVETFALIGHPKAKRAFGWSQPAGPQNKEERFVSVLEIPPVNSAQMAVKMAFADDPRKSAQLAITRL
jgi:hypothetical protein